MLKAIDARMGNVYFQANGKNTREVKSQGCNNTTKYVIGIGATALAAVAIGLLLRKSGAFSKNIKELEKTVTNPKNPVDGAVNQGEKAVTQVKDSDASLVPVVEQPKNVASLTTANVVEDCLKDVDPTSKAFVANLKDLFRKEGKDAETRVADISTASKQILNRAKGYYGLSMPSEEAFQQGIVDMGNIALYKDGKKYSGVIKSTSDGGNSFISVYKDGLIRERFSGVKAANGEIKWDGDGFYSLFDSQGVQRVNCLPNMSKKLEFIDDAYPFSLDLEKMIAQLQSGKCSSFTTKKEYLDFYENLT